MHVWNHPIDLHLAANDLSYWYFFFLCLKKIYIRPKANFKVWRLDSANKIDICINTRKSYLFISFHSKIKLVSYGVCILPKKAGYSKLVCETWSPTGASYAKANYDALSFYMGNKPRLQSIDVLSKDVVERKTLNTQSSGKIILEIEVIFLLVSLNKSFIFFKKKCLMKNFELLDISGQTE